MNDIEPGSTIITHPADYASIAGVRRTRVGRWVYRGRTYRTRALALVRVPKRAKVARFEVVMDEHGVAKAGHGFVIPPLPPLDWESEHFPLDDGRRPWRHVFSHRAWWGPL